jgi:hypothetical protein
MAGHLLFNSGSNESSLAPQFKWLDNTFKIWRISPHTVQVFCVLLARSNLCRRKQAGVGLQKVHRDNLLPLARLDGEGLRPL